MKTKMPINPINQVGRTELFGTIYFSVDKTGVARTLSIVLDNWVDEDIADGCTIYIIRNNEVYRELSRYFLVRDQTGSWKTVPPEFLDKCELAVTEELK